MSISILSSNLVTDLSQQLRQNPLQQMRQDFKQLSSALQSGNLTGAQSAYSNLQQLFQGQRNGSTSTTASNPGTTIQNDFATLGEALQSGDLSQAQSAFSQLQKDFQTARQTRTVAPPAEDQYVPSSSRQGLSVAQQVQQDYAQLNRSLQSGDLSGAQSAFAGLQQALESQGSATPATFTQGTQSSSNSGNGPDTISNDISALSSALSSGNLGQAQSAFSQLKGDIQTAQKSAGTPAQRFAQGLRALAPGHHHHHHHGGSSSSSESSTSTIASTASSSTEGSAPEGSATNLLPAINTGR